MMKRKTLFLLLIISCFFTNCVGAQEKPLTETSPKTTTGDKSPVSTETTRFESKEGNFSIGLSQIPTQIRSLDSSPDANPKSDPGKHFFWHLENTEYAVMYLEFGEKQLPYAFVDMNTSTRAGIEKSGRQIISEKAISFGTYSGREFKSIAPNGVKYIGRNYLVNNTGYSLTAAYADEKDEKAALEVLDSFKLLTEKN